MWRWRETHLVQVIQAGFHTERVQCSSPAQSLRCICSDRWPEVGLHQSQALGVAPSNTHTHTHNTHSYAQAHTHTCKQEAQEALAFLAPAAVIGCWQQVWEREGLQRPIKGGKKNTCVFSKEKKRKKKTRADTKHKVLEENKTMFYY